MMNEQLPVTLPIHEATERITRITTPIHPLQGSGNQRHVARIWSRVELDGLILTAPNHDGQLENIAREVYHRLAARFLGAEIYSLQQRFMWFSLLLAAFGWVLDGVSGMILAGLFASRGNPEFGFPSANILAGLGGVLIGLLPSLVIGLLVGLRVWFNAQDYMCVGKQEELKAEALKAVRRCFLRAIPPNIPLDLHDLWRHGWLTNQSRPLSAEIVDTDAASMVAYDVVKMWGVCAIAWVAAGFLGTIPVLGLFGQFLLIQMLMSQVENPGVTRAKELDRQNAVEGSVFVAAGGLNWASHQEEARIQQLAEAQRDTTKVFVLGKSTGLLAGRGDMFAPSADIPFSLSLLDLQNHLLVLGGTGSGKTSGILRPLAYDIAQHAKIGMVIMDGKAALPNDLRALNGMKVVDPAKTVFSLVSGLTPNELVNTLADILRPKEEKDPFWSDSAIGLLRRAAILAQAAGNEWWTLQNIGHIAASETARAEATRKIDRESVENDPVLQEALLFFAEEWESMDSKPKSGVLSMARTWLSTITAHPDLLRWANTAPGRDSFDLLSPLTGGRLGFLIPEHRYGRAGSVVTALLKARIYSSLKNRAERDLLPVETPLVLIIDEAQEVATRDDATMLAMGRSLGLAMVAATQSVEGINDKLGDSAAAKWLAIFGNAVCLIGRSPATNTFMAQRVGSTWRPCVSAAPGASVRDTIAADALSGAVATTRNQPSMGQWYAPNLLPLGFRKRQRGVMAALNESDRSPTSTLTPSMLIHSEEFSTLLAEPNLALAVITRARVPRRDVIKLAPRF